MTQCGRCGFANPAGVEFCGGCRAFLDFADSDTGDPAPEREPAPVQPAATTVRTRPRPAAVAIDPTGPLPCGACGIGNDLGRRFCRRCGSSLTVVVAERRGWWRRLLDRLGGRRPRPAGFRPRSRGSVRPLTVVLAGLLGIVAIVALTPALREPVVDGAVDAYDNVRDRMRTPVSIAPHGATASSTVAGADPAGLIDADTESSWAPAGPAVGQWIEVRLDRPQRVVSVIITSGISADRPTFLTQARPREVDVTLLTRDGGPVRRTVTLLDNVGGQQYQIKGSDVVAVRLTIRSAYGVEPTRRVAIAELELFIRP